MRSKRYKPCIENFTCDSNRSFKKTKKFAEPVNKKYLENIDKVKEIDIAVYPVISAEMDEMWSFYHDKKHQIWLWWAVEHKTNIPLAYTFGTREHKYLDKLLDLLKPFPIRTVYADNNFAYENKIKYSSEVKKYSEN